MGNKQSDLNEFQRGKLLYEFKTFYDMDGDEAITVKDFELVRERVCRLNQWSDDSEKALTCEALYSDIWSALRTSANADNDGRVTREKWVSMWRCIVAKVSTVDDLPLWMHRYLLHRFQVLDRTGDGIIDQDEYEYVMNEIFDIPIGECRQAWLIFTQHNTVKIDLQMYFQLADEYFFSTDPAALGNFVMGLIQFDELKK